MGFVRGSLSLGFPDQCLQDLLRRCIISRQAPILSPLQCLYLNFPRRLRDTESGTAIASKLASRVETSSDSKGVIWEFGPETLPTSWPRRHFQGPFGMSDTNEPVACRGLKWHGRIACFSACFSMGESQTAHETSTATKLRLFGCSNSTSWGPKAVTAAK